MSLMALCVGEVRVVCSDPSKAEDELGWHAEYGIDDMVRDNWYWHTY